MPQGKLNLHTNFDFRNTCFARRSQVDVVNYFVTVWHVA
jgi:hypothetical protein